MGGNGIRDSRGVAVADLDLDGRLDIAINNNNARPTIYLNRFAETGNWLRLLLIGTGQSNRDAVGANIRLTVATADGSASEMTRWVEAGSGYASQSSFAAHFGLGEAERVTALEIRWPSGRIERLEGAELATRVPGINRTLRIEESAISPPRPPDRLDPEGDRRGEV